jgi:hypothetical protein
MKKRIALEDKKDWSFELEESVIYYNDRKVYQQVKSLTLFQLEEKEAELQFDLSEISLPNLEEIMIVKAVPGEELVEPFSIFDNLSIESFSQVKFISIYDHENIVESQNWSSHCKNLESIQLDISKNEFIPLELSQAKKIKKVMINGSKLHEIPDFIFKNKHIEVLDFHSCNSLREIGDDIKYLTNLNAFVFCYGELKYVSPNVFKLPKLVHLNFAFTTYKNPQPEIYDAIKDLKSRKPNFKRYWMGGDWFGKIWDQV